MTVSITSVAIELARPTPDSPVADQWDAWINRAYRLILNRLGQARYDALDDNVLDDVVLAAVVEHVRAWRDTTASQYTVTIDDGTVSRRFDAGVGYLTIPDELWQLLEPTTGTSGAFTITPYASPDVDVVEPWA